MRGTAKPTERQKRLTILADSLAKQSVSRQWEFLWKATDLHQPGSTGQCRLTALVANSIFIRLDKWDNSLSLCSSGGWGTIRTSPRTRHAPHQSTLAKKIAWEGDRHTDFATTRPTRPSWWKLIPLVWTNYWAWSEVPLMFISVKSRLDMDKQV